MKNTDIKWLKPVALVAGIVGVTRVGLSAMGEYFYDFAIKRKKNDSCRKDEMFGDEQAEKRVISKARAWLAEIPYEDWNVDAEDQIHLHAHYLPALKQTHQWVILVHGYTANYKDCPEVAKEFYERGYHVLLVDNRAHGLSGGKAIGFGWPDRLDILKWIDKIVSMDEQSQIVLIGYSMGASTVMNATGEELPKQVKACVEDSGYSSTVEIYETELKKLFPQIPSWIGKLAIKETDRIVKRRLGYSIYDGNCIEQLKKSNTPTLFVHGENDSIVPFEMVFDCYYACNAEKELYTLPDTNHTESTLKPNYFDRVFRFINRFMEDSAA